MIGTFWEMKGPVSANENTIKNRFKKAKRQADGRAIFDLRIISSDSIYVIKVKNGVRRYIGTK